MLSANLWNGEKGETQLTLASVKVVANLVGDFSVDHKPLLSVGGRVDHKPLLSEGGGQMLLWSIILESDTTTLMDRESTSSGVG